MPYFSVIIPVYNRPDEVRELLESLSKQTLKDFEVLLIEDGSVNRCDTVAQEFDKDLNICYFYKENSGRSLTRNYGMERASGEYLIFFDLGVCFLMEHILTFFHQDAYCSNL